MATEPNVFGRLIAPTETDYVAAVRKVILGLVQHHTQKYIAQRVGVEPETIHNAQEGKTALKGWVISRIEWEFGSEAVKPIRDLGGGNRPGAQDELAAEIRPHVDAIVEALAERARSRLGEEATRGQPRAAA